MIHRDLAGSETARRAGSGAFEHAEALALRVVLGVVLAFAVLLVSWALLGSGWLLVGIELAAIGAMLLLDRFYSPQVDRWLQGARGEQKVGEIVDALADDGWFAIHDVAFGRGNIDHIVVGVGGLFTIETKSRKRPIRPDWVSDEHLRQAFAEAMSLERVTGYKVQPLLVFSDAWLIGGKGMARRKGVVILTARTLDAFFARQKPQVSVDRARAVHGRLLVAVAAN
jgi:hypothetical protein